MAKELPKRFHSSGHRISSTDSKARTVLHSCTTLGVKGSEDPEMAFETIKRCFFNRVNKYNNTLAFFAGTKVSVPLKGPRCSLSGGVRKKRFHCDIF